MVPLHPTATAPSMSSRPRLFLCALILVSASVCGDAPAADAIPVQTLLKKYCAECHGKKTQEGNLRIDRLDQDIVGGDDADRWHEVLNRLNVGEMPPEDKPQPTLQEREAITEWLTTSLKKAAQARRANGGQIVLRRLNRREYGLSLIHI